MQAAASNPIESAFSSLRTDIADLTKRMKKFQKSKVTNLADLEKRKAEEAEKAEQKENAYVGKVFKVHKARLGFVKLKKHLKEGTQAQTYEKILLAQTKGIKPETNKVKVEGDGKYAFQVK